MLRRIAKSVGLAIEVFVIGFDMAYRENRDIESILGMRDELTELPNLRAFRRDGRNVPDGHALVLIDIDDFKKINDEKGHLHGDSILKRLARVLEQSVGICGKAYRLHGDEYAILVRRQDVAAVCLSIQESIREEDGFTVSQGVVSELSEEVTDEQFGLADAAMYQSKRMGKAMTTMNPVAA